MAEELHYARALLAVFIGGLVAYLRQPDAGEDHGYYEHDDAENGVGQHHLAARVVAGEEKLAHDERGGKRAEAIERLREVEAARGCGRVAKLGDIRVGRRLEKHQSAPYDEERAQVGVERAGLGAGDEEQRADAKEHQAEDDAGAVAVAVDEPAGGNGHDEIAEVSGDLDERRLRHGNVERVLEVLVEHVENGAGEAPEEEEGGYEDERQDILLVGESWSFHYFVMMLLSRVY